jgi:hypothetical protein
MGVLVFHGCVLARANKCEKNGFAEVGHALQRLDKTGHAGKPTAAGIFYCVTMRHSASGRIRTDQENI